MSGIIYANWQEAGVFILTLSLFGSRFLFKSRRSVLFVRLVAKLFPESPGNIAAFVCGLTGRTVVPCMLAAGRDVGRSTAGVK